MAEEKKNVEARDHVITLKTPYKFEGQEYTEIDLSGLEKLTVMDAIQAQKNLANQRELAAVALTETATAFAREMAAKATGLPIEFFKMMPRGASKKVVQAVREFINTEEDTKNHVMHLEKPYFFNEEKYTEIDLSGVANINSMNESAAENKMTQMGFMVTETTLNYYYACCIASMATGKPEEFFTGLPFCETIKLKSAVNDPDFFG